MLRPAHTARLVAALAVAGCASPGMPPGGPPDPNIPVLVSVRPDTNAVNVRAREVIFFFDEVISERPGTPGTRSADQQLTLQSGGRGGGNFATISSSGGGPGGTDLASIISVSPTDGRDEILWRRTAIEVRPRRGFRANTTYRITLFPGVADLRGNVVAERTDLVFSTGATISTGELSGVVFDYAAGKSAPLARVEVFTEADTALRWVTRADSSGRFTVRDLAPGRYRVRGFIDTNNDRSIGLREAYDSTTVEIADRASVDIYAFVQDTIAPRVEQVEFIDSTGLKLKFDRPIVADWQPTAASVLLLTTDSTELPLASVLMPSTVYDSLARIEREAARRAADTLAARDTANVATDSTARPDSLARPTPAAAVRGAQPTRLAAPDTAVAAADTVPAIPPPKFDRLAPIQQWSIRLGAPLPPGTYRLIIVGAVGLNGASARTEREIRVRPPAPPAPPPADR